MTNKQRQDRLAVIEKEIGSHEELKHEELELGGEELTVAPWPGVFETKKDMQAWMNSYGGSGCDAMMAEMHAKNVFHHWG